MRKTSFYILRIGLAITFLWIGVLIFQDPAAWGGFLQPWAARLLPIPVIQVMVGTAFLDMAIGFLLLVGYQTWLAAFVGSLHLVIILTVSGIDAITVRDIGLLAATLALSIESLPTPFPFLQKIFRPRKIENGQQKE